MMCCVCVYVRICICICMYVYMHTSLSLYIYIYIYIYMYVCMYACVHTHIYTYIYIYIYVCVYRKFVCLFVWGTVSCESFLLFAYVLARFYGNDCFGLAQFRWNNVWQLFSVYFVWQSSMRIVVFSYCFWQILFLSTIDTRVGQFVFATFHVELWHGSMNTLLVHVSCQEKVARRLSQIITKLHNFDHHERMLKSLDINWHKAKGRDVLI